MLSVTVFRKESCRNPSLGNNVLLSYSKAKEYRQQFLQKAEQKKNLHVLTSKNDKNKCHFSTEHFLQMSP